MRNLFHSAQRAALLMGIALSAGGCTGAFQFKVDAIRRPGSDAVERPAFRLVTANPELEFDTALFDRTVGQVRTALAARGWFEAPDGTASQMEITIDYGRAGPFATTRVDREPIYWQSQVRVAPPGDGGADAGGTMIDGPFEQFGDRVTVTRASIHRKFLRLTACEVRADHESRRGRQLWSVTVQNDDESPDLPRYLPLMVAAAMDFAGRATTARREIVLTKRDRRVVFIEARGDS